MPVLVKGKDVSEAWIAAMAHLLTQGRYELNLIVTVERPDEDEANVRSLLTELAENAGIPKPASVADTLFPEAFYSRHLGSGAREHLYKIARLTFPVARKHPKNLKGTYFERMINFPRTNPKSKFAPGVLGPNGEFNQLERLILRLQEGIHKGNVLSSAYEIGMIDFEEDHSTEDLSIYSPGFDNSPRGFPCLSHISLTYHHGALHMTALYRNQTFLSRAYGNLLGLGRLLAFICNEVGCPVGELTCIASHADSEVGGNGLGSTRIKRLISESKKVANMSEES